MFRNVAELVALANQSNKKISDIMIEQEMNVLERKREEVIELMDKQLQVMEAAAARGLEGVRSHSQLTGGDAVLMQKYLEKGRFLSGEIILEAVANTMATNEVNAAMGTICATPTAGSAGVVPGTLFAVNNKLNPTREQMIDYLFTAGAFGYVIANNASISGAQGGCQAEIGSAAGMAAAAIVEMAGGSPEQCAEAMAISLKNMLGLVCDPVAGLVEVPCVKRNAMGAANAMVSADMALAGIKSRIPCDEVIGAMHRIGQTMPSTLRETGQGGLAATPTGRKYEEQIFGSR